LKAENNFLPNLDSIPAEVANKAKLLILNLPGNPVPANPTMTFFNKVVAFAKKHNITVVHDAAYSEFYFAGDKLISFREAEGAKERGDEINSLSTSFSIAGARIAYITGNSDVIHIMRSFKSKLDYGVFATIQEAAVVALNHAEEITDQLRITSKERHHVLMEGLKELGWKVATSAEGVFDWAKYAYDQEDVKYV